MLFSRLGKKSDEELMRLLQQGDGRALTTLYQRYSTRMIQYFYRMLWKDKPKAQDFLHDLFVKILEGPASFDTQRKFSTWLYSVAHNMCKNEYRKQAYRTAMLKATVEEGLVENLAHAALATQEFNAALESALDRLNEDDKHLFALRYTVEMPLEEIADVLECPLGTVKSRLFYLKKKLTEQLQGHYSPMNK